MSGVFRRPSRALPYTCDGLLRDLTYARPAAFALRHYLLATGAHQKRVCVGGTGHRRDLDMCLRRLGLLLSAAKTRRVARLVAWLDRRTDACSPLLSAFGRGASFFCEQFPLDLVGFPHCAYRLPRGNGRCRQENTHDNQQDLLASLRFCDLLELSRRRRHRTPPRDVAADAAVCESACFSPRTTISR